MEASRIVIIMILFCVGVLFFFNNKSIGKGAAKFYKWFYTEKRLIIMFKILGIFLMLISLIFVFVE